MKTLSMTAIGAIAACGLAVATTAAQATPTTAPVVAYTDAVSGPVSGGENNLGAYLSIYGLNFGSASALGKTTHVYIGGAEVANYRGLVAAQVAGAPGLKGMQALTVQVGALGGQAAGTALPVTVVVNGVTSTGTATFTPNAGHILFVSLAGNDATAVPDDINHPYRHLQHPSDDTSTTKTVAEVMQAGDHIVIRGGNWSDVGGPGDDGSWFRFRYPNQEGSAPTSTGAAGHGWIHFTAYPGEYVHYSTPAGARGGIQGANSVYFKTTGDYVSISNLHFDVDPNATSDAAPVNLQYSAGPWRVVNNEIGPWKSAIEALAAGVSGHGNGTTILGNHIHDIGSATGLENHGIYADSGASNWNVGYNWVNTITGGNLLQFYDNLGLQAGNQANMPKNWKGFTGMQVHHNVFDGSGKYGLNLADGIVSGAIWNNVISNATFSGLRINTDSKNMALTIAYNTFYDNDQVASGSGNAQILNTWGNYGPTGVIRVVDNVFAAGPKTVAASWAYRNVGNTDAYLQVGGNLWWFASAGGDLWMTHNADHHPILLDPRFTAPTTGDLTLQAGSGAIDAGLVAVSVSMSNDLTTVDPRPVGAANDLGAFERQ